MVYKFDSLEACWERIKADIYWSADIWDKEKLFVRELAA